jgi:hypothetical protein
MRLHRHSLKSLVAKAVLAAVVLGGLLAFSGAPAAQAEEFGNRPVVRYDNFREREAIARHGYYSRRAEYWRHERREVFVRGWRDRYGYWHR